MASPRRSVGGIVDAAVEGQRAAAGRIEGSDAHLDENGAPSRERQGGLERELLDASEAHALRGHERELDEGGTG